MAEFNVTVPESEHEIPCPRCEHWKKLNLEGGATEEQMKIMFPDENCYMCHGTEKITVMIGEYETTIEIDPPERY